MGSRRELCVIYIRSCSIPVFARRRNFLNKQQWEFIWVGPGPLHGHVNCGCTQREYIKIKMPLALLPGAFYITKLTKN